MNGRLQVQNQGSARVRTASRDAFTLIEMIVVIVVMALLMGITFRLIKPSEHAQTLSATVKVLGLTNAAIAEYQAEYGIYPPVLDPIDPDRCGLAANAIESPNADPGVDGHAPGVSVGYFAPAPLNFRKDDFYFGLAAYLVDRRNPSMDPKNKGFLDNVSRLFPNMVDSRFGKGSHWYARGTGLHGDGSLYDRLAPGEKEQAFYRRIRPMTKHIVVDRSYNHKQPKKEDFNYFTIRDAWDHDLVYICPPPHTSYALFSAGPDGKCVASDPLNPDAQCPQCKQYHNKDNVYSSVNAK